jgi:S1-C subfamily serine protease
MMSCSYDKQVNNKQHVAALDFMGMNVGEIDDDRAEKFRKDILSRVVVLDARWGSSARNAGVVPGDIICEVNWSPIVDLDDLKSALASKKSTVPVTMLLFSIGGWRFIAIAVEESRFGETGDRE